MPKNLFTIDNDFFRLKIKDLLEAREQNHVHFMHKENVLGTAIGRYRIRKSDPWPDRRGVIHLRATKTGRKEKTLENSEVRPYSWPCILVLVKDWIREDQFGWGKKHTPDHALPDYAYMPDGRKVPVCVVKTSVANAIPAPPGNFVFPHTEIGGGFPVLVDVQEKEHVASIGCLVTDGHLVYALTNRHVCGSPGEIIYSIFGGNKVPIGRSSAKQLSRKPFTEVYPDWLGANVYVNLDVGLVEIDDLNSWTSKVYGIGPFNRMQDLSCENISLKLIGQKVRAYGCASRTMEGEIQAMFFRYKSEGGFEYVADFFIGRRKKETGGFSTHPGDSGTIWFVDEPKSDSHLTPLAVQWGGKVFAGEGRDGRMPYALATCLSTVCNLLDVGIVTDWTDDVPYWGALGHYSIATLALAAVGNNRLKKFLQANIERISFPLADLEKKTVEGLSKKDFVPLADVPDLVWKMGPNRRGDKWENPNHFADMDKRTETWDGGAGKTLLEICEDKANIDVPVWKKYYEAVKDESRGTLPFRIWQIYRRMVEFVRARDWASFLCAAGVLSHYVGDACQPLHISFRFDGDPEGEMVRREVYDRAKKRKVMKTVPVSKGVHGEFDKVMVDYCVTDIKDKAPGLVREMANGGLIAIRGGRGAGEAAVELMRRTFGNVDPKDVCDLYGQILGLKPKPRALKLWDRFGKRMLTTIADGAYTLASLWESAWKEGNGDGLSAGADLGTMDPDVLSEIYVKRDFLKSCNIDTIKEELE
ncbi:MAG: S1/P1 Nuclease [Acidobacteriota bacterium]